MAARKTTIEFLPQEEWEKGIGGKILKWALTVGRHIVIFTELVVILAFLSRFKFDRDLSDLGEKIKQQQAIVESLTKFEKEFRFLDKRLETIENLRKTQLETDKVLTELAALVPVDVYLSDFNVADDQFDLTATTLSEIGLGTFLKNLKESPEFGKIVLSKVSSGEEGKVGIEFQLEGTLISGEK